MVKPNNRSMTLAFSIALVLLLSFPLFHLVSAAQAQGQLYNVMVRARCDIGRSDARVPIYLDGADSGFSTPHEFTSLTGFHNFSVSNEHVSGHFVKGPPSFQTDSADAGLRILSEGVNWIIIGPPNDSNSEATIEFRYGSAPFVENFRDTFEPGTTARVGVKVYMDPSRIASGHLDVYNHSWPVDTARTPPLFTSDFTIHGIEPAFVQFQIPKAASTGSWGYEIALKDSNLDSYVNASFEVAFHPTLTSASFPSFGALPHSTFSVAGSQYAFFENPQAFAVVLYIGGGTIGEIGGPTPINGYSNASDQSCASYRLVHDLVASGFSVVSPSGPWEGLDFPSQLVDYLRKRGENEFYAIGHSAGGVVIANNIITHPSLFSKAIIADAPLTQESTGYYFTDLSILSENVMIPHLLVWGRGDQQAKLENAYAWMDHANKSLATLKVYDYDHDWAGTTVEIQVRKQILGFLTQNSSDASVASSENLTGESTASVPIVSAMPSYESSPDFQIVKNFGNSVLKTRFGSSLMASMGAWQIVLNPSIWQFLTRHLHLITALRWALHPAILILAIGTSTYSLFESKLGAVAAAVVMSSLIGATCLSLPFTAIFVRNSSERRFVRKLRKRVVVVFLGSLGALALSAIFILQILMIYATLTLVFDAMISSALLSSVTLLRLARVI